MRKIVNYPSACEQVDHVTYNLHNQNLKFWCWVIRVLLHVTRARSIITVFYHILILNKKTRVKKTTVSLP